MAVREHDLMRMLGAACAVLLAACGSTLVGTSPSAAPSATASNASPPLASASLPGSAVRITVNGASYTQGAVLNLTPTGAPVVIELAFPFAVDRPELERWLPRTAALSWIDDRTARLEFAEGDPNIAFKVPEARAKDGGASVGLFIVSVAFPQTRVVDLFTPAELFAGPRVPAAATSYRIASEGGLTVSPDGRRAIAFGGIQTGPPSQGPALIDLATRARTQLTSPPATDGPFALADWLPDGRLILVGKHVWLGDGGRDMRSLADAFAAVGNQPWTATVSPSADRVAIWGYNADGHIAVIDLRDGSTGRISGPFRRFGFDTRVSLVWSRDSALLAGTDADSEVPPATGRVRIVDLATDRTLRTIEGGARAVTTFPTGELVVVRDSDERGAGARNLGLVLGFDGVEHRRYLGGYWWMSPDARYLLQDDASAAGMLGYTLTDLVAGRSVSFGSHGAFQRWLADGRLAFY